MSIKVKEEEVVDVENVKQPPALTDAQMAQQVKVQRKRAADELTDYKKRVRSSNELKELQVRELELNIAYYKNKKEWMDLAPAMEELEAEEQAIRDKAQKEREEAMKALKKKDAKPKIVSVGGGKPRSK